ncbi:DUF5134 domain-containing protein [Saccharopolyspora sp. NPDC002578]
MYPMGAPGAALVVVLAAAAAVGAVRLIAGRRIDTVWTTREADAAHLVMNLAMAVMFTSLWGSTARSWVLAVVVAGMLGIGVALARPPAGPGRRAGLTNHLIAFAAMGLAVLVGHSPGHAHGHDGAPGGAVSVVVVLLAAWFAVDLVATVVVAVVGPPARLLPAGLAPPAGRDRTALRVASFPHAVMAAAMTAMLLAVL